MCVITEHSNDSILKLLLCISIKIILKKVPQIRIDTACGVNHDLKEVFNRFELPNSISRSIFYTMLQIQCDYIQLTNKNVHQNYQVKARRDRA